MDNRNCLVFIMAVFMLFGGACNCGNTGSTFPDRYNYTKPLVQPLQFTPEKKLQWTITKKDGINPVVKKLDIDALPSVLYDSNGFKPMKPLPATVSIGSLPETAFKLNDTSHSIIFKTSVLPARALIKSAPPSPVTGSDMALYDFGVLQGYQGKLTTCFFKDHNELIWIGSNTGVDCYNGENIKSYPVTGSNELIVGMSEDKSGRIWAISTKGIMMIDQAKNTISRSTQVTGLFDNVSPMTLDHNGNIIVGNIADSGFAIINPSSLTYKHITNKNGLSDNNVFQVEEDKNHNYWATTAKGIDIIQPAGTIKHIQKSNGLNINPYAPLFKDNRGNIWTGQNGRLEFINIQTNTITHYGPFAQMEDAFILQLAQDKKGRIWAATNAGIFVIDTGTQSIKYIYAKQGIKADLSIGILRDSKEKLWIGTRSGVNIIEQNGDIVYPVSRKQIAASFQQQDGKIWIGSSGAGIEIIDRQKKRISKLTEANGIGNNFIQSIQQQGKSIWITTNAGLDMLDINKKTITHIGKKEGLANNVVYGAMKSRTGDTWLIGPNGGLDVIDSGLSTIKHLGVQEGLSDSNVVDVKPGPNGSIWIATSSGGVGVIDPVKQTIKYINDVKALKGASNKILFADAYNNMWIATNEGICIADNTNHTVTTLTTRQGLSNNHITSFSAYKNGVLAGANARVNIVIPTPGADTNATWKINPLINSDGLAKTTNSWTTDFVTREGEFWWCDNGVTIINEISPANDSTATFVTGLTVMNQPKFFISKTVLRDKDTLWDADTFYVKGSITPLEAAVYKQGLSWDSIAGPYNMPENLRIPYHQNYLQFHFTQASLGRQDTVWYTYILEGIDKQWSPLTNKSASENYLNLQPGTYTFKVKSRGLNGSWSSAPDFTFIITPPWWATTWFRVISVVALVIVIYAIIKERSKKLKAENLILEQKVADRTAQLKRSLEELKATQGQLIQSEKMASLGELTAGIAHEIQNPLNFVNNFSEVNKEMIAELKEEINKGNYDEAKLIANDIEANEEKINYHGRRADAIVKSMMQHSRQTKGVKEPTDINALCDEYLRLAYHGMRAKDKSFNAEIKTGFDKSLSADQAGIGKINVVPQDMGRALLNLINNAFYATNQKQKDLTGFSNLSGQQPYVPTVTVVTKKLNDKVEIKITDNGNGIPQNIIDKIFQPFFTTKPTGQGTGLGLSLAFDIVKAHGGEIKVETLSAEAAAQAGRAGEGTAFIIQLPA